MIKPSELVLNYRVYSTEFLKGIIVAFRIRKLRMKLQCLQRDLMRKDKVENKSCNKCVNSNCMAFLPLDDG